MTLREMGQPDFMAAVGSWLELYTAYTCIHRIRSQHDMRSENQTMKISSRWLHHRFMLSRYTTLTTTRGSKRRAEGALAQLQATFPSVQAAAVFSWKESHHDDRRLN